MKKSVIFIVICFASFSCKKSKLNPYCWGTLENARIYNWGCPSDIGMIIIYKSNGQETGGQIVFDKIPKEFKPASGDSMDVKVNYKIISTLCFGDPCTRCGNGNVKIHCIQKK